MWTSLVTFLNDVASRLVAFAAKADALIASNSTVPPEVQTAMDGVTAALTALEAKLP